MQRSTLNVGTRRYHAPLDGGGGGGPAMDPVQMNMLARRACIQEGVNMWQQIWSKTYTGTTIAGTQENVPLRQVGLVKRLLIQVSATVQANGQTLTLAPLGITNFLSNITLNDLSNQTRINTPGWHLYGVASAKRRLLYGAAYTTDSPSGYGSNYGQVFTAPSTITTNPASNNVFFEVEVPLSYTDTDLRGALYMNVTNATAYLQYTINPNVFATSTADPTLAVYKSSSATLGLLPSVTVTVYQNYLDQLPIAQNGGPILPLLDLSTAYMMSTTPVVANVNSQDIPVQYANFRDFLSTFVIYDNGGVLNTGSDINYWALQSANYTNIFKYPPNIAAFLARSVFGDDPPGGVYYFDHRDKPISTIQYGNMQLVMNASNAAATGNMIVGWEMMALINMVTQAGSLYGN